MDESLTWIGWYAAKYGYLFLIVLALAALEVQIEGKYGWVKNLPTWRVKSKIFAFFMGGKDLTGYMFYLLVLLALFFHLPFFGGVKWTWQAQLEIVFLFLLFSVFWDFLWFVLNPYYGIKRLKKSYVYWHKKWIFGVPLDYPRGIMISFMFALPDYPAGIYKWGIAFFVFVIGTALAIGINKLYREKLKGRGKKS